MSGGGGLTRGGGGDSDGGGGSDEGPTWPVQSPTTRSAMKVSSVSPERWLTITPQPWL